MKIENGLGWMRTDRNADGWRVATSHDYVAEIEQLRASLLAEQVKNSSARHACQAVLEAVEGTDFPVDGRRLAYALLEVLRGYEPSSVLQHHGLGEPSQ